jgi:hypothetical protein
MRLFLVACGENVVLPYMSKAHVFIRSVRIWQIHPLCAFVVLTSVFLVVLRYNKKTKIYGCIMKEMKSYYAIFYSLSSWFCNTAGTTGKAFVL